MTAISEIPPRPLRILIVDDDRASREVLVEVLERLGHPCSVAASGASAWTQQLAEPADVVLSDWMMPGMSGLELCRRVRAHDAAPYTYFLFMTALRDKAHFLEGMRAGADDYITKPIDMDELEARLISATRVVNLQRALAQRNTVLRHTSDASALAARTDPLTGCSNRLQLREDFDALKAQISSPGLRHSAALCDLDRFKEFNDAQGHVAGDEALRAVAATMHAALPSEATLYRYGGEEFLFLMPGRALVDARQAMERVRCAVADLKIPHPPAPAHVVTISVGIAAMGTPISGFDDWLHRADLALYRAKDGGRNRIELDV